MNNQIFTKIPVIWYLLLKFRKQQQEYRPRDLIVIVLAWQLMEKFTKIVHTDSQLVESWNQKKLIYLRHLVQRQFLFQQFDFIYKFEAITANIGFIKTENLNWTYKRNREKEDDPMPVYTLTNRTKELSKLRGKQWIQKENIEMVIIRNK